MLFSGIIVSFALMYYSLMEITIPRIEKYKPVIANACIIAMAVLVSIVYLKGYYGFVYRDAPIPELTYKMESGVYKGLYTVEERGKALVFLEREIQKVTGEQDKVLFKDQVPQAYLMTKARHCTPSTWDIQQYTYVYKNLLQDDYDSMDDSLLHEYFKSSGRIPSKIIYVQDKERLEHLSIWDENFRFNQYVEQNYRQTYANNADQFAIIVFERNEK